MPTQEQPLRPLDLDPARVVRADRPHYAIIDIGSNSVASEPRPRSLPARPPLPSALQTGF